MQDTTEITRNFAMYFAMPLWQLMGFADYWCHRATRIERTSGLNESLLHALMLTEMAIPVTLCLFFEVTSLVVLFIIIVFFLHEATAIWDIAYAEPRRDIWIVEQHIHSYLAVLPFMMGSFVICLNWDQFLALFGIGSEPARFDLTWKQPQFSVWYHAAMISGLLVFLVIPYAEEAWRCWRERAPAVWRRATLKTVPN